LKANKLPAQTPQPKKSDAVKKGYSAGATCLGEYLQTSWETNTVESKKRKFLPSETSMELDLEIGNEQLNEAVLLQEPNHHNKAVLLQEPNHHNEAALLQEPNHHNEAALPQEPNHHNEVALPQEPNHNQATPSSVLPQGPVWPSDLIPILRRIAELPCRQPSKPLFAFEFNFEAANKNFILLKLKPFWPKVTRL
jgi:hypothetical protein